MGKYGISTRTLGAELAKHLDSCFQGSRWVSFDSSYDDFENGSTIRDRISLT
jgi:hypothetical protein